MRRVALLVAALGLLLVPAVGAAQTGSGQADQFVGVHTTIHVSIQTDGDARWTVTLRFPLHGDADRAAFDRLRTRFLNRESRTLSVEPFRAAAERVASRTGQRMTITDVERSAEIRTAPDPAVGVLRLSFTWTEFARIGESKVRVGRAFAGGWFGDLHENQTLLIEPPPGYKVHTVEPLQAIASGTLRWDGPQEFGPGQPVVTFVPVAVGPLPFGWTVLGGIGGFLGVLAVLAVAWHRDWIGRGETGPSTAGGDERGVDSEPDEPTGHPETGASRAENGESSRASERPAGDGTSTGAGAGGAGSSEAGEETGADAASHEEELLSDEERVEKLLRENDGRMKQARIVEETRWSNAKVSQLLSSMAEEGRVEKLRLGRENLISLPDEED